MTMIVAGVVTVAADDDVRVRDLAIKSHALEGAFKEIADEMYLESMPHRRRCPLRVKANQQAPASPMS